jgi:PAS domain S-box-containing protein
MARRQRQQRQADDRWRLAIEAAGGGLWDWDLRAGTSYFSPHWKAMLGHAPHEIDDNPAQWQQRVHPDDLARVLAAVQAALDDDQADYACEYRMRCKDGRYIWVRSRGAVTDRDRTGHALRMAGLQTEITDLKEGEARLTEALHLQHSILDAAPNAVIVLSACGVVLQFSRGAEALLGHSAASAVGHLTLADCPGRGWPGGASAWWNRTRRPAGSAATCCVPWAPRSWPAPAWTAWTGPMPTAGWPCCCWPGRRPILPG